MRDPNDSDWLTKELQSLKDLKAPQTLLPRIMEIVKRRASRRFYTQFWSKRLELFRTCAVAAGLALSVLVPLANLPKSVLHALAGNPVFAGFLTCAETGQAIWLNASIFQLPLPAVSAAVAFLTYLYCAAAVTVIHRTSGAKS